MLGGERQNLLQSFQSALGCLVRNARHHIHADIVKSRRTRIRKTGGKNIEIVQAPKGLELFFVRTLQTDAESVDACRTHTCKELSLTRHRVTFRGNFGIGGDVVVLINLTHQLF